MSRRARKGNGTFHSLYGIKFLIIAKENNIQQHTIQDPRCRSPELPSITWNEQSTRTGVTVDLYSIWRRRHNDAEYLTASSTAKGNNVEDDIASRVEHVAPILSTVHDMSIRFGEPYLIETAKHKRLGTKATAGRLLKEAKTVGAWNDGNPPHLKALRTRNRKS